MGRNETCKAKTDKNGAQTREEADCKWMNCVWEDKRNEAMCIIGLNGARLFSELNVLYSISRLKHGRRDINIQSADNTTKIHGG